MPGLRSLLPLMVATVCLLPTETRSQPGSVATDSTAIRPSIGIALGGGGAREETARLLNPPILDGHERPNAVSL